MKIEPAVHAYILITWVLEAQNESKGFGFPFDKPHYNFYCRLKEAHPIIKWLKLELPRNAPKIPLRAFHNTLGDNALKICIMSIEEKISDFETLRAAMRIAMPDDKEGLNAKGDNNINKIEEAMIEFRGSDRINKLAEKNIFYKKMVKQIDKYWDKLFRSPILVVTSSGKSFIQPQRTNNIMEQFFRSLKSGARMKSGKSSLSKILKSMLADTPLIKNLENPDYMKIILNGKEGLTELLSDIDVIQVRKELKEKHSMKRRYPRRLAEIFKFPNLPKILTEVEPKMTASC